MFDAGAIVAHLDIDQGLFDRKMSAAERRVKDFEDAGHKVKISAVFDNASMGRARQLFTQLDQQLSREAMQRLRSSPQGSVLGALNALFSPHPVTGGPSASQSASQGLLGRIVRQPASSSPAAPGGRATTSTAGGATGVVRQVLTGQGPGNVNTTDTIRRNIVGAAPGNVTTTDTVVQKLDQQSADKVAQQSGASGNKAGKSFASAFSLHLTALFGGIFKGGDSGGGKGGIGLPGGSPAGFGKGLAGGIGPSILGIGLKASGIIAGGGAALGALPALGAVGGALGIAGAGAGVAALGAKTLIGTKNVKGKPPTQGPLFAQGQAADEALKAGLAAGAAGMLDPLKQALVQIPALMKSIIPSLRAAFAGAGTLIQPLLLGLADLAHQVLPLLGQAFRAVAPLVRPLLDGLAGLISGLLPGLITLLKVAGPAINVFAQALGTIGKDLGGMFAEFAPVIKASSVILKALLDVISGLFPIIGKLAAIFATALAPVFVTLAGVIQSLLPFLVIIGKVLASLAGAILGDLVGAFMALANLLKAIAPALTVFANVLSQAFTVLENSGVFAIIGDALEKLVKPLASLINALLTGLTPILPVVIQFFSQLSTILINGLVGAVTALLPPLTTLATNVLAVIAQILPVVLPLLITLAGVFTGAVVAAISGVATALSFLINAVPLPVLTGIVAAFYAYRLVILGMAAVKGILTGFQLAVIAFGDSNVLAAAKSVIAWVGSTAPIVGSFIAMAAAATATFIAENLATLGIIAGITLLVAGIVWLATHWGQAWGDIKNWAVDAWHFIDDILHNKITQIILAVVAPILLLALHWRTLWADARTIATAFWGWLSSVFGGDLVGFFTRTIPGWWDTAINFLKTRFIQPIQNGLAAAWNWVNANFGTPIRNFFTSTIPGYFNTAINFLRNNFVTPFQNDLRSAWNWVVNNVGNPLRNFFTVTIPGAFQTAVSKIGQFWGGIQNIVRNPIVFIVDKVLDGLIRVFDDITNAVGLGKPIPEVHPFGLKAGGRIMAGTGPLADDVLARVSRNETVVSAKHSKLLAPLFAMLGIPGYAPGGIPSPGRGGTLGVTPQTGPALGPLSGLGKLGDIAKIILDLGHGDTGAAGRAFASLIGHSGSGGMGGVLGSALVAMPGKLIIDAVNWLIGNGAGGGGGGGVGPGAPGPGGGTRGANAALARKLMPAWASGAMWQAWNALEMQEAGWWQFARNPSSGAYGIPQALPPSKMGPAANPPQSNVTAQIRWMIGYIQSVYGNPIVADAHERTHNWYGKGGPINEPIIGYGQTTGSRYQFGEAGAEYVVPGGGDKLDRIASLLSQLIDTTASVPHGIGGQLGMALSGVASDASFRNRYPRGGA